MVSFKELIEKNRSYRRFDQSRPLSKETLGELVDGTRLIPSIWNTQSMRYWTVSDPEECEKVFATVGWAAQYKDWDGPEIGEHPTGYIFLLRDKTLTKSLRYDDGIAAATLTLYATSMGLGCCIMQNCNFVRISQELGIDRNRYVFSLVIALGHPVEKVQLEEVQANDTKYWRTADKIQHVPKRKLADVWLNC